MTPTTPYQGTGVLDWPVAEQQKSLENEMAGLKVPGLSKYQTSCRFLTLCQILEITENKSQSANSSPRSSPRSSPKHREQPLSSGSKRYTPKNHRIVRSSSSGAERHHHHHHAGKKHHHKIKPSQLRSSPGFSAFTSGNASYQPARILGFGRKGKMKKNSTSE